MCLKYIFAFNYAPDMFKCARYVSDVRKYMYIY